ncbi:MAG: histidine phosphatase family protein [Sciscionella sp.]
MSVHRIVLLRHGETEYNATGRLQGHLDSMLTEVGWNQARFAVPALARFDPVLTVTSDLRRARDTAGVFAKAAGVTLRVDKRLRETNIGVWQGMTPAEVDTGWPGDRSRWAGDPTWAPPGGEARVEVAARATELIAELDTELEGTVLLCTHGGTIAAVVARVLELPLQFWPALAGIGNCHWTVLTRRRSAAGSWRLATYNAGITG